MHLTTHHHLYAIAKILDLEIATEIDLLSLKIKKNLQLL